MSICNDIIKRKKFKQFTYSERLKLEALLKIKNTKKAEIAELLKKTVRSINREIKKGLVELKNTDLSMRIEYSSQKAEQVSVRRASNKGKTIKLGKDHKLANHIENKIKNEKWSPAAIIGEIKEKGLIFDTQICVKTVYNYIDSNIFLGVSNKDLPVKKNKKKRKYKKVRLAYNNIKGRSIEERPKEIDLREEYGHWEMDCVIGKKNGGGNVLLVLTERVTRQEIVRKIP
ncbi:MAG: IS30 family transposase, partial [Fusobacteriaceae bacterium]